MEKKTLYFVNIFFFSALSCVLAAKHVAVFVL